MHVFPAEQVYSHPYVTFHVINPRGELVTSVPIKGIKEPIMMHDFAITQRQVTRHLNFHVYYVRSMRWQCTSVNFYVIDPQEELLRPVPIMGIRSPL